MKMYKRIFFFKLDTPLSINYQTLCTVRIGINEHCDYKMKLMPKLVVI